MCVCVYLCLKLYNVLNIFIVILNIIFSVLRSSYLNYVTFTFAITI